MPDDDAARVRMNRALEALPSLDIDPMTARAHLLAAQRRLSSDSARGGRLARYEPIALAALSFAHVVWAVLRVLSTISLH